eukprot:gnl/MRDRNA2_/MRDRNA2_78492_c0_seq1.p1 gnl/MRDRNA2_/MRDRNA2_78492_c0~~gnl/MRDRNA2_/MRDRNA2_78492_c0_seq1.p1  ORF type:complete len:370 (+),score=50.59 gnl/MRDRNA2_/MRDRNA2_78492_c0_seq1:180-1289(+)
MCRRRGMFSPFLIAPLLACAVHGHLLRLRTNNSDSATVVSKPRNSELHPQQAFVNNLLVWSQSEVNSKGTFVLLHGCGHFANDWFELPEEKKITQAVVNRGYAVLVPNAPSRVGGCWVEQQDGPVLYQSVQLWLQTHGMEGKPLYAVGISSGGVMIAKLVTVYQMTFKGIHFVVSPGAAFGASAGGFSTVKFPRTSFVYMPKDSYAPPQTIQVAVQALKKAGTPVVAFKAAPKQVNTLYVRSKKMDITKKMMAKCIRKLYEWGYLESRCRHCPPGIVHRFDYRLYLKYGSSDYVLNLLVADPEVGPYLRAALSRRRALEEELHVIEGFHGSTAEHVDKVLNFLLSQHRAKPKMRRLLRHRRKQKKLRIR